MASTALSSTRGSFSRIWRKWESSGCCLRPMACTTLLRGSSGGGEGEEVDEDEVFRMS
jgi:hypothetical protein